MSKQYGVRIRLPERGSQTDQTSLLCEQLRYAQVLDYQDPGLPGGLVVTIWCPKGHDGPVWQHVNIRRMASFSIQADPVERRV